MGVGEGVSYPPPADNGEYAAIMDDQRKKEYMDDDGGGMAQHYDIDSLVEEGDSNSDDPLLQKRLGLG